LDGYRALAIKTGGKVLLRSRNDMISPRAIPASQRRSAAKTWPLTKEFFLNAGNSAKYFLHTIGFGKRGCPPGADDSRG
jgi:hypothetical protein